MRRLYCIAASALILAALPSAAQERARADAAPRPPADGQPRVVDPGDAAKAPSDAIVLFDGSNLSKWVNGEGQPTACKVVDRVMSCTSGAGNAFSTEKFRSAQIHLEFAIPSMPDQEGQMRGNSGVYLPGGYELQILDSYRNSTYATGALGALYGQSPPLVNVARPPGQWQAYDIIFHAPECDSAGALVKKATVTALLNGVLVQDHVAIEKSAGCDASALMLQDHSGFPGAPVTTMRFRNIWFRPL